MSGRRVRDLVGDQRGFILGWLGRLLIGFVLVAIVLFDGGSILVNYFTLDSTADEIAVKATTDILPGFEEGDVETKVRELALEAGAKLVSIRVENNILYVTLRRRADTLVVGRISPIADWARATVEGQAGTG